MKNSAAIANEVNTKEKSIFRQAGEVIGSIGAQIANTKDHVVDFVQHEVASARKTAKKIGRKLTKATKKRTLKNEAKELVKKPKKKLTKSSARKAAKKIVKKTQKSAPAKKAVKKSATHKRK